MVTFKPPAVEPELPPINIKTFVRILPDDVRALISTVLNPAVLGLTDKKKAFTSLSLKLKSVNGPPLPILVNSNIKNNNAGTTIKIALNTSTTLEWTSNFVKLNLLSIKSLQIINPEPPIIINNIIVIRRSELDL